MVDLAYHQVHPEPKEIIQGSDDARKVEELTLSIGTVIMVDGNLSNRVPGVLYFFHQFDTDHAARFGELHPVEDAFPKQSKITIYISQLKSEGNPYRPVIEPSNDDAVEGIGAANLVTVDEVDAVIHDVHQRLYFSGIVLRVTVGIENELLGGGGKTGAERTAVALVLLMLHYSELGDDALELGEDVRGVIPTTVVDHHDLEVIGELTYRHACRHDHARDGTGVVVRGEENGNGGTGHGAEFPV